MKMIFNLLCVMLLSGTIHAQSTEQVVIKTSAECGSCKERIEQKLNYVGGVKFAELNVATKELTVKFSPKKISLVELKKIISELGYDADEVKANPESLDKLPACCKPGGMK